MRARAGVSLIEIMVVLAIMAAVLAISVPTVSGLLALEQSGATKELGLTYKYLRDEAALRNVTFRIVYNLDARTYKVEVGDPSTLVFSSPDEREDYEEEREDRLKRFTQRELEEQAAGEGEEGEEEGGRFDGIVDAAFDTEKKLPSNSTFAWVWTPQYEEPVEPSETPPEDPADAHVVYSYIFPNGTAEYTLVRIVDIDDPNEGFTLEVEPMSGRVTIHDTLREKEDASTWSADQAPELDL